MSGQPSYLRYFQEPRKQPPSPMLDRPPSSTGLASNGDSVPSLPSTTANLSPNPNRLSQQYDSLRLNESDDPGIAPNSPYDYRRSPLGQAPNAQISSPATQRHSLTLPPSSSPVPAQNSLSVTTSSASASQSQDIDELSSSPKSAESPPASQKAAAKGGLGLFKKKSGEGGAATMGKDRVSLVNPQRTLSKELKNLVNNPDYCDIIFILEDKPLYAHRCILASRSQKFQQLFNNVKDPRPEIHIPNIRFPVFLAMMYFLYTDSVDVSLEYTLELMGASQQFALDLLKSLCERVLEGSIHVENVCWIFQGADRFKSTRLRDVCLRFVTRNFDLVSKTTSFQELDRDLILEIIKSR